MNVKDIISKLSSYNLFNYLFPGFVFAVVFSETTNILSKELKFDVISVVLIYFVGLLISRFGSNVLEEILKRIIFLGKIDTESLLKELEKSTKFEIIFEAMNMYRTIAAGSFLLSLVTIVDIFIKKPKVGNCFDSNWVRNYCLRSLSYCILQTEKKSITMSF